jgi:hypothetical protein
MTTAVASPTDLAVIGHRIRTEWAAFRTNQIHAWQGYIAVGELLMQARQLHPGDREYGRWLDEQHFGFSRQWANRLVRVAENRPHIEALLETAVSAGSSPPGVNALLATLTPPRPRTALDDADPLDHPLDVAGYDEYGTPLGYDDHDTASHLYEFRIEVRVVGMKVPSDRTRARGDKEGMPRESVESEAVRNPIVLPFTVASRERGWQGFADAAERVKQALLSDEILRRDWPRIPKHGERE